MGSVDSVGPFSEFQWHPRLYRWSEAPEDFAARMTDTRLSKLGPYRDSDPVLENFILNHGPLHRNKVNKLGVEQRLHYYTEMIRELRERLGIWIWENRDSDIIRLGHPQ